MHTETFTPTYPENAYRVILGETEHPDIPSDAEETLEYVMGILTRKEAEMFMLRFKDEMTCAAIGEKYGLKKERVHFIISKAIRKLHHRSQIEILSVGREAYLNLVVAAKEEEKKQYYQRISDLEALMHKQVEEST